MQGLRLLTQARVRYLEPGLECIAALQSEDTGILDTHELMRSLEADIIAEGEIVAYSCEAMQLRERSRLPYRHGERRWS